MAKHCAAACDNVLERGGVLTISSEIPKITGAHARILKDMGVVEQTQADGARARPLVDAMLKT